MSAVRPSIERGHREGRASTDTHGPRAKKEARGGYHRISRTSGLPCATGLRLIRVLPGAPSFLATVACAKPSLVADLILASEYQDHAISPSGSHRSSARLTHAATRTGHRIPHQRFVTFAKRPSRSGGMG